MKQQEEGRMARFDTMHRHWLRLVAACLLLWCAMAGNAMAAITVNSILVNGGSTANVNPGDTVTITVNVTISGGTRWRSTAFTTSPGSSLSVCSLAPDLSASGTYTRTFSLTAPSGSGVYSVNVTAWTNPNCNGTASAVKTLPGGINTGAVTLSLNHVRIQHDGSGLTCAPETITLRACANAACTTAFTDSVSVNLGAAGTWSAANPVVISGGSRTLTLSNASATTVSLSGTVTSPAATTSTAICYNGSTANNCSLTFSNGSCSLDAVEVGKAPNTPIFTKRTGTTITLNVLALNSGVINTSSTATISAQLVQGTATGCSTTSLSNAVSVTLTGANAGRGTVILTPNAASRNARVRLVSGALIGCSSDNFAIRPPSFTVSPFTPTPLVTDGSGTTVSGTSSLRADSSTFGLIAASGITGYDGTPLIDVNMVEAPVGNTGTLSGTLGAAAVSSGSAQGTAFKYSEVGYFRLNSFWAYDDTFADIDEAKSPAECVPSTVLGTGTAADDPNSVTTAGLIGCYFGSAQTTYYGRFTPAYFVLTPSAVVNRSATASCTASAPTFSYLGEPMTASFSLEARNGSDEVTTNYTGTFARLTPAQVAASLGVINAPASGTRTPFTVCSATPAHPCFTPGTASVAFTDGVADVLAPLTLARGAAAVGPFADLKIGVKPADADGVAMQAFDVDATNVTAGANTHTVAGTTIARYGRMSIDNAYGSELLGLTMTANAQYWNGTGYAINTLDNCTPQAFSTFAAADYSGMLTAVNMPFSKLVPGSPLASGTGKFVLGKPGIPLPTGKGSVVIRSSYSYLPGYGRATFGLYKAGPVIYVRETY